jgi:serine/threonine protein kinase
MTDIYSQADLRQLCEPWLSSIRPNHRFKVYTDTTDIFRIEYGDILMLNDAPYLIRHNAKEGRFGLDDEEKFWVKRAIDLKNGQTKIIKLVFHEKFLAKIGDISFECFRSPKKEERILNLVAGHPNFMQGFSVRDDHGNNVRVLDMIQGESLGAHIRNLILDHEPYFHEQFPPILDNYLVCIEAIQFLHDHGEKHGDIRRDHILVDRETGKYRWIDFDYNFRHRENMFGYDLFGLGNVLMYLVGKGDVLIQDLHAQNRPAFDKLVPNDVNIIFNNRVANLKKIYPYIPESLNRIMMNFSKGVTVYYDNTVQLLEDLKDVKNNL